MTDNLFIYDDISQTQAANRWDAPTPGYFGGSPVYSPSPSPHRTLEQQPPNRLGFLPLAEWEEGGEYDEQPPRYICYTISWRIIVNHKNVVRETEQDLVVAPSEYWKEILKAKFEDMLPSKKRNQRVRSEGTSIVVSVTDRTQSDLEKFYKSTNINWAPVEKQLHKWSNLLRIGKKLKIVITFNYGHDDSDPTPTSSRAGKIGASATRRMLAERDAQIDAEEDSSGQSSIWRNVYNLMRCSARSCHLGPWCWEDPREKKHHKLRAPHLRDLVRYVEKGGILETHDDVPGDIRRDLYLEEQQRLERGSKKAIATGVPYPPININVLPAQSAHASVVAASPPRGSPSYERLEIPGPRDAAVRKYCAWQESQETDETRKADFRQACDVTLSHGLDLELVEGDQNPEFFVEKGVTIGTARRFIRDIRKWAAHVKNDLPAEERIEEIPDDATY